tara:strand:+ start:14647 stop:15540 length:894 start_codon:yes stop_codon:yes gene_type:complete
MTSEIELRPEALEQVLLNGDIGRLSSEQRLMLLKATCDRVGLDPLAKPFEFLRLNGKTVLYATKSCTDQLRSLHKISIVDVKTELVGETYTAIVTAKNGEGRIDSDMGSVFVGNKQGEMLSNLMMKAVTKGKRRVTLSMVGLGVLDETETDTIPGAQRVTEEELDKQIEQKKTMTTKPVDLPGTEQAKLLKPAQTKKKTTKKKTETISNKKVISITAKSAGDKEWWNCKIQDDARTLICFSKTMHGVLREALEVGDKISVNLLESTNSNGDSFWNIDSVHVPLSNQAAVAEIQGGAK